MEPPKTALELLTSAIESALAARRGRLEDRVRRVEQALEAYRRAAETLLAREFAREHGFAVPAPPVVAPDRAAAALLAAVRELPELAAQLAEPTPEEPAPQAARQDAVSAPESGYPSLLRLTLSGRIVVIGALSGRDRASALPGELADKAEWIDTERDGAHAVGNLPQRIRQGRVAAVIILDRVVQHKHTEGVMAAARDMDVPIAFAGQGGKASLLRAIEQLESALRTHQPSLAPSSPAARK